MKTALIAIALFATTPCWAGVGDGHIDGPMWSVDFNTQFGGYDAHNYAGETAVSLQNESLFWASDTLTISANYGYEGPVRPYGTFDFIAADGYAISGFDITYDLAFATNPHIADGTEYGLYFPETHLAPGTVIAGIGSFAASTGAGANFDYLHTHATLTDHLESGAPFSFQAIVTAFSGEYCTTILLFCGNFGLVQVPGFATLNSVTITPNVVAVPEPETYALILGGLALLMGRRAREAAARALR